MRNVRATTILSRHDAATRRLLERLGELAARPDDVRSRRELGAVRARLIEHLADAELIADEEGIDTQSRRWMRRALHDTGRDGLPALVSQMRSELAEPTAETARAA